MESSIIDFFRDNILIVGLIVAAVFGYVLLLIRKRKKQAFLHQQSRNNQ